MCEYDKMSISPKSDYIFIIINLKFSFYLQGRGKQVLHLLFYSLKTAVTEVGLGQSQKQTFYMTVRDLSYYLLPLRECVNPKVNHKQTWD